MNFSKCLLVTARRLSAFPSENKFKQIANNMAAEISSLRLDFHNHMASCFNTSNHPPVLPSDWSKMT